MSATIRTPIFPRIASASVVVGPFAASATMRPLILAAFPRWIWFSRAAGMTMSQSTASTSAPFGSVFAAPGKPFVEPLGVHRGAVVLADADDLAAVLLVEDLRDVVADVSEPLDDDSLALERPLEAGALQGLRVAEDLAQPEDHAASRRLAAAADPALGQRLAGDARPVVDAAGMEGVVGVGDPGHLALARAV